MITPEERYVLLSLWHGRKLRLDGAGWAVVDVEARGMTYRVHQALVDRLLGLGLVERSAESGGSPELSARGREVVAAGPPAS